MSLNLPEEVAAVLRETRAAELSTFARDGTPITVQTSPLWRADEGRFLVTTAIGLPNKAYNARRDRRVAILYSSFTGSGLTDPAAVLVQGDATVSDLTLWNDELAVYWPWLMGRQPASKAMSGNPVMRWLMDWYYMRLLIHVQPRRIRWWPGADMTRAPREVDLPAVAAGGSAPAREATSRRAAADPDAKAWEQTAAALAGYDSAVLTGVDPSGYPTSLRLRPAPDMGARVLRVDVPAWAEIQAGPASLMSHGHDDQLWNLRGFVTRGALERSGEGWAFRPHKFVLTAGGGPGDMLRFMRQTRRDAAEYLRRRNLPRPRVPWEKIKAAQRQAAGG